MSRGSPLLHGLCVPPAFFGRKRVASLPMSMSRRRPCSPGSNVPKKYQYAFVFQTRRRPLAGLPVCILLTVLIQVLKLKYFFNFLDVEVPLLVLLPSSSPSCPVIFSHAPSPSSSSSSPSHQRKRKADGGFAVPTAKSRSAEAQQQHPSGRGASSSSSSHGRGGGCAAAAAAASSSSSCAQQHQEEGEGAGGESCRRGGAGSSLRERSSREASRKIGIGREALERLKRCNVPPSAVSEHDVEDRDDPVSCAEYVVDMYKRFKELEVS